ncbi:MAG: peptide deformylase [Phycisphaerales bacterium]|nr:peptide deformylase [Phycisphaerales bacterium]
MPPDSPSLRLVLHPDPVLRAVAAPVQAFTPEIERLAQAMLETMRDSEGIGLAAPQVGRSIRMFVAFVPASPERSPEASPPTASAAPEVFINPVLSNPEGEPEVFDEGCLSLPGIRGDVMRPPIITIAAFDAKGRPFTRRAGGLLARCWQHEMDHLNGVLILDRFTPEAKAKNRSFVRALERSGKRR